MVRLFADTVLGWYRRRMEIAGAAGGDAVTVTEDLAGRDPVLAALATASVLGLPPAGPARRKPKLIALRGHGGRAGDAGPTIKSRLCADYAGFGLHAATTARADDARGRQALVKYVLRPPVANERLEMTPDGNVRLLLKKAFRDGTAAIEMQPLALLTHLATAVPPPRRHVVGYYGVLASASRLRPLVVPPLPAAAAVPASPPHSPPPPAEPDARKATHRCRYRPVIDLLRRTFGDDLAACQRCAGRMRLVALVKDQQSIDRFLRGIGQSNDFPPMAPARAPPYFNVQGSRSARNDPSVATEPSDESA